MFDAIHGKVIEFQTYNELQSNENFDIVPEIGKPESQNSGFNINHRDSERESKMNGLQTSPILSDLPNFYKHNGISVENSRFIKFIPSEKSNWLMSNHPVAYLLLNLVALRAQRIPNHPSGINVGESLIGDYGAIGATRQQYRTALDILTRLKYLTICETSRTRKKSTIGTTTTGTKVKLLSSDIWDINLEDDNQRINQCPTNAQPMPNHDQEYEMKMNEIEFECAQARVEKNENEDSEILKTKDTKGCEHSHSIEELIRYFRSKRYTDDVIKEALKRTKTYPEPISNVLTFLESACRNIRSQNAKESVQPKQKEKQWNNQNQNSQRKLLSTTSSNLEDTKVSMKQSENSKETISDPATLVRHFANYPSVFRHPKQ